MPLSPHKNWQKQIVSRSNALWSLLKQITEEWCRKINNWRKPLTIGAISIFVAGLLFSWYSLKVNLADIQWLPLFLLVSTLIPLGLLTSSVNLHLCAKLIDRQINIRTGVVVSAIGTLSELLPLPGGAMVRGAALMRAGATFRESTGIVAATAILTLTISISLGSLPILLAGYDVAYVTLLMGLAGTATSSGYIFRLANMNILIQLIFLRLCNFGLAIARVTLGFWAIGLMIAPLNASLFAMSSTIGSSIAIIPSGIGVSEGLSAALASLIDISPTAAFLVVAVLRILNLLVAAVVAGTALWTKGSTGLANIN